MAQGGKLAPGDGIADVKSPPSPKRWECFGLPARLAPPGSMWGILPFAAGCRKMPPDCRRSSESDHGRRSRRSLVWPPRARCKALATPALTPTRGPCAPCLRQCIRPRPVGDFWPALTARSIADAATRTLYPRYRAAKLAWFCSVLDSIACQPPRCRILSQRCIKWGGMSRGH